eukprot:scaffold2903_cov170-Amphora_coffeaeformis.AAC.14
MQRRHGGCYGVSFPRTIGSRPSVDSPHDRERVWEKKLPYNTIPYQIPYHNPIIFYCTPLTNPHVWNMEPRSEISEPDQCHPSTKSDSPNRAPNGDSQKR